MTKKSRWIWQRTEWPIFIYDHSLIAPELAKAHHIHGLLEDKSQFILRGKIEQVALDTLCDEVFSTAAIEGEGFSIEAVHASVMRKKGLVLGGLPTSSINVTGKGISPSDRREGRLQADCCRSSQSYQ